MTLEIRLISDGKLSSRLILFHEEISRITSKTIFLFLVYESIIFIIISIATRKNKNFEITLLT